VSDSDDFHRYTQARSVCNEVRSLAERYVAFDINEPHNVATDVTGVESCVGSKHLTEGLTARHLSSQ
jgi:hypothetical protein